MSKHKSNKRPPRYNAEIALRSFYVFLHKTIVYLLIKTMMKKQILFILVIFSLTLTTNAQTLGSLANSVGLVDQIMQAADVNKEQATGGAGALFEMAKGSMDAGDFAKVSDAVPNMDELLAAVPAMSKSNSLLSTATTTAMGMPQVISAFEKLGISKEKVSLFTPVLVSWVEKNGGKLLGKKLGDAIQ